MVDLMLDVSVRTLAAAAAVGVVLIVLRVRSGAARHAAWSAVLVSMMTMPVLVATVPRVDVPVPASVAWSFGTFADEAGPSQSEVPASTGSAVAQPTSAVPTARIDVMRASPRRAVVDLRTFIMTVYGAGALLFFIQMPAGWIVARRLARRAVRIACDNRAPVFETPAIAAPMTTGIIRPRVLLPIEWRAWPEETLRAVLAHENAHIARRDSVVAFLARVNRAAFWFHPLAWWLERTLAVAAEHACDETAARQVGQTQRYAAVLLDMADAVRRRGRRVSWHTLGVDGAGVLGARIDRLLKDDAMARMPSAKRAAVAVGCAAMLIAAIACRQQIAAPPLRPDATVQKQLDAMKAREARFRAALAMTPEQAATLERSLDANPDNADAHESLIVFYDQSGKVTWPQKLAGIRKHALWRIAHLSETETDLWVPDISKRYDPQGYADAKKLWLEQTSRPDATAATLGRAAAFFTRDDKPLAEKLLIRAGQLDQAGPWRSRRMDLYAQAIAESAEAQSAFAVEARRTIEASSDPKLLADAGFALRRWGRRGSVAAELATRLFQRAVALDPQNVRARTGLADLRYSERMQTIEDRLRAAGAQTAFDDFSSATAAAVSALPVDDRLFYLPGAAEGAYMRAEYIDYTAREKSGSVQTQARQRAGQGFARAGQYASQALALAPTREQTARDNDVVYRAQTVLAVLALKDGDRQAAVEHMRAAGAAPVPDPPRYVTGFGLQSRLAEYLLRAGERTSVAGYLDESAERMPGEEDQLLKNAARVRQGVMPMFYQYAEARR